jgi:hypothetical protein
VAVASVVEAIVDAEVVVGGNTITLHTREGAQLGTTAGTGSPLYQGNQSLFAPLLLPVDWMP